MSKRSKVMTEYDFLLIDFIWCKFQKRLILNSSSSSYKTSVTNHLKELIKIPKTKVMKFLIVGIFYRLKIVNLMQQKLVHSALTVCSKTFSIEFWIEWLFFQCNECDKAIFQRFFAIFSFGNPWEKNQWQNKHHWKMMS